MKRFTEKGEKPLVFFLNDTDAIKKENGIYTGAAIDRLGAFESIVDQLNTEQEMYARELAKLRDQGKKNSARFRELMGKKLMGSNMLAVFKAWGLE